MQRQVGAGRGRACAGRRCRSHRRSRCRTPSPRSACDARADRGRALRHRVVADQPDLALASAPAARARGSRRCIGVSGWSRMPESRQQLVADEQVAAKDRAAVLRERGAGDREVGAERIHQRFGDRADVAGRRRVEGRAVLEVDTARMPARAASAARRATRATASARGHGARLQRDDDRVGVRRARLPRGTPISCTVRMPARTSMLATSVAPVKSSAMTPSVITCCRSAARQLDAGEPRIELDHRRIVLAAVPGRRGREVELVRGGRERQRERELARRVEHDAEVLDEDVDGRQRRVIARQDVRHAVLEHPAHAGAVADHVVQRLRVGAGAHAQRHRLARGGDVHAGEMLVHHLHGRADAGAVAEPIDLAGDRIERSAGGFECLRPARGHHRHLPVGRLLCAARDRPVDQPAGRVRAAAAPTAAAGRVDRGGRDHDRTGLATARRVQPSCIAEQHLLGLRRVDDQHCTTSESAASSSSESVARPPSATKRSRASARVSSPQTSDAAAQRRDGCTESHRAEADHPEACVRAVCVIVNSSSPLAWFDAPPITPPSTSRCCARFQVLDAPRRRARAPGRAAAIASTIARCSRAHCLHEVAAARLVAARDAHALAQVLLEEPEQPAELRVAGGLGRSRGGTPGLRRRRRGRPRPRASIAFSARRSVATWRGVARSAASAAISPSSTRRTSTTCTTASTDSSTRRVERERPVRGAAAT